MGRVGVFYDIMPESVEVSQDDLMAAIPSVLPKGVEISEMRVEPIAFGLKKIVLSTVMDDKEGLVTELEEALMSIDGVQNVECVMTTLL